MLVCFWWVWYPAYSEDLGALEQHVRQNPSDLKSVNQLAVGLFRQEKYLESLRYWKHLARQRPDDARIRFSLARCFYMAGQVDEALIQCHRIRSLEGGEKCSEMFSQAETDFPDSYNYYKARLAFAEKKYEESMELLTSLLENDVEHAGYRNLLASHYRIQKQYDYAWDNYNYAAQKLEKDDVSDRIRQGLEQIGKSAYDYVESRMSNHGDESVFFERLYFAAKLYEEESLRRMRGLYTKAIDYYRSQIEAGSGSDFVSNYRIGSLYMALGDSSSADEAFSNALNDAPDDFLYATVEYLRELIKTRKSKEKSIEDLIAMAGGEDVYNTILKAAEEADKRKLSEFENEQSRAAMDKAKGALAGLNKDEFIAEFDNFKRRMANASSEAEKQEIKAELQSKYGHLMNDPNARSQLEAYMSTEEGKKLKDQYSGQIEAAKSQAQNFK
ncbi:MAG: tetratricopeptide repeat protein [Candidatus Cloacimonetes bacterium]|nr:tetratricopeptide repeat protein [Candidatus Cloacimonadota bacterium]